jgi:acetyltransferase-like isoleucine patch superfamily enzyme
MNSYLNENELKLIGLAGYGKNVLISRNVNFYNSEKITLGNNVRIDDFCILSGKITIGSNVHIAAYCQMVGTYGITISNFSGLSSHVTIYSASDDYDGVLLTNPMNNPNPPGGPVYLGEYVIIGSHSVILPRITINDGVAVGALSLVNKDIPAWKIVQGIPVRILKDRTIKDKNI